MSIPLEPKSICPYLGVVGDKGTYHAFPVQSNLCYKANPPGSISLEQQANFCLAPAFASCPVFVGSTKRRLTPQKEKSALEHNKQPQNSFWFSSPFARIGFILVIMIVLISTWYSINGKNFGSKLNLVPSSASGITTTASSPSELSYATLVPLPEFKRKITSNPIANGTAAKGTVPTPSPTAITGITAPRPSLGLYVPLGLDHKFLFYQVQPQDSINLVASKYGTTINAVLACNYELSQDLLVGAMIVIPLFIDTQGYPAFQAYQVTEEISLEQLAVKLSVDLNEFKYYNALDANFIVEPGDWLLVPRAG